MLRILAILIGIAFIFVGVAGFLPSFTTDGLLFNIFEVNAMHNIVHIVTGVLAIMASTSFKYTRFYFRLFGFVYLLIAILGFWRSGDIYLMHSNMADNIASAVIGIVLLYLGFTSKRKQA